MTLELEEGTDINFDNNNIHQSRKHNSSSKGSFDSKQRAAKQTNLSETQKNCTYEDISRAAKFYRDDASLIDDLKIMKEKESPQLFLNKTLIPKDPRSLASALEKMKQQSYQQYQDVVGNVKLDNQDVLKLRNKSLKMLQNRSGLIQTQDISYLQDNHRPQTDFPELSNPMLKNMTASKMSTLKETEDKAKIMNGQQSLPLLSQTSDKKQAQLKKQLMPTSINQLKKIMKVKEYQNLSPGKIQEKPQQKLNVLQEQQAQKELEKFMSGHDDTDDEFFKNYYLKNAPFKFSQPPPNIPREDQQSNQFDYIDQFFKEMFKRQKGKVKKEEEPMAAMFDKKKISLGNPTGRRDAQLLGMWFEQMIKTNVKEGEQWESLQINQKQTALDNIKCLTNVCIKEVIRQVSVQCQERGILLEQVLELNKHIQTREISLMHEEQALFKRQHEEEKKRLDEENLKLYLYYQDQLDVYDKKIMGERDMRIKDSDLIELMKVKVETLAEKNGGLIRDAREKDKQVFNLKDEIDQMGLKIQKLKDKKRMLDKKVKEQIAKDFHQQQDPNFFLQKRRRQQSTGQRTEINEFEQNEDLDYSKSVIDQNFPQASSENRSFKYSRPMTLKQSDRQDSQYCDVVDDNIALVEVNDNESRLFAEDMLGAKNILTKDLDEISLDSFQLISRDDELVNDYYGQDEDEHNYIQKEILMAKFQQEMEYSKDFENILNKAEEIFNIVMQNLNQSMSQKEKRQQQQQPNILQIIKDVISVMFKDELKMIQLAAQKFLKIKDQILDEQKGQRVFGIVDNLTTEREVKKVPVKDFETQTELIDYYDFADIEINIPEVFKYEKKANKLVKMIIEREDKRTLIKQFEYIAKSFANVSPIFTMPQTSPLQSQRAILQSDRSPIASRYGAGFNQNLVPDQRSASQSPTRGRQTALSAGRTSIKKQDQGKQRDLTPIDKGRASLAITDFSNIQKYDRQDPTINKNKLMTDRNKKIDDLMKADEQVKVLNQTIREMLKKIQEYESAIQNLQNKKQSLANEVKVFNGQGLQQLLQQFNTGFETGFQHGLAQGFFKGSIENQNIYVQKGLQEGLREGWMAGFEDGADYGIKKVFKEAYMKGIDLSSLDVKDFIDINKLRREKMNEYERIFNQLEYSDKQERLLRILSDYKAFSKKKKLKYAIIGKKNLLKMVNQIFTEKYTTGKSSKQILMEVVYDVTKIKYGNDGVTDKKLYRLFSSAIFHAPSCKRIAMFARFLQLGKRNLSNEILHFYLHGMYLLKNKNFNNALSKSNGEDETVGLPRALDSFKELFEGMIPIEIFPTLRKKVEQLIVKDETTTNLSISNIDVEKFLEYCTNIYQRFHLNYMNKLQLIFNAWTLYSENFMQAEEIFCIIKVFSGPTKKTVIFSQKDSKEEKTAKEVMMTLKEKLGSAKSKIMIKLDQFIDVFQHSDLCNNMYAQRDIFDAIVLFEDQDEMIRRFQLLIKECLMDVRKLFFGTGNLHVKIPYLDPEDKWIARINHVESMINVLHPSLLELALIIYRRSLFYFQQRRYIQEFVYNNCLQ